MALHLDPLTPVEKSIGGEVDWLPHGYNEKVFQPRDRVGGRTILGVDPDVLLAPALLAPVLLAPDLLAPAVRAPGLLAPGLLAPAH